jgi:hypothetical protein
MLDKELAFIYNNICRDGVSEGQFYQVLLYELDAIRKVGEEDFVLCFFQKMLSISLFLYSGMSRLVPHWKQVTNLR